MSGNDNAESSNIGGSESLIKVVNENSPSKIGETEATTLNETENKKVARRRRKPCRENIRRIATSPLMSYYVSKEINSARIPGKIELNNGTEEDMEYDEVLKNEPAMEDFVPKNETPPSLKKTEATSEDATSEGSNPTRKRKNTSSG